ncbi:hypothetical protein JEO90_06785 [Proteus vulgaris]|uniref:hypothetical protein n=1 Tax=Proteus vulgaris TaxID=585 RepID=UPI0018E4B159|nr:hypothetical protein [Proteus vulgaris]MBI6543137.1 hypothetical protein [Proteus vulgaris]
MAIKARKVLNKEIDKNNQIYYKEAVEFYDDVTDSNIDPTGTNLTSDEIIKMANDAFNGMV